MLWFEGHVFFVKKSVNTKLFLQLFLVFPELFCPSLIVSETQLIIVCTAALHVCSFTVLQLCGQPLHWVYSFVVLR